MRYFDDKKLTPWKKIAKKLANGNYKIEIGKSKNCKNN